MIKGSWSIKELLSWALWNAIEERADQIQNPIAWRWKDDLHDLSNALSKLESNCHPEILFKIKTSCLISSLITKNPEVRDIAKSIYETTSYFKNAFKLSFDDLWNMRWSAAPWVGVIRDQQIEKKNAGIIGYAIAGVSDSFTTLEHIITPNLGAKPIDEEAKRALKDIGEIIVKRFKCRHFIILLLPESPVYGGSFSLSTYAAVWSACNKKKIPQGVVFSGKIDKNGNILPIGRLKEKIRISEMNGFKAIVYGSERGIGVENLDGVECVSIGTLDEFNFLMNLYAPGYGKEVHKLHDVLRSPESFATRFYQLDEKMIGSMLFDKACREYVPLILEDPVRAEEFSDSLERASRKFGNEPDLMKKFIEPVKEDHVKKLVFTRPHAAWTIAFHCSMLAAREGGFEEAKKWEKIVEMATDRIIQSVGIIERKADLYNRQVITSYHMTFFFSPELPKTFLNVMKTLEKLSNELSLHVIPALGKMYGTAAQHYGFCGPAHLHTVESYVKKAQKAFGNGTVPELYNDFNRQWNYLVYAYLDAHKYEEAEEVLQAYLGVRDLARMRLFYNHF